LQQDISWPRRPIIYEIYTWVWLDFLSQYYKRPITLDNVPEEQWEALGSLGVDAVWLMGVWERSPLSIQIAHRNEQLQADFLHALSDYTPVDTIGSAYAVHRYIVDARLGGPEGLAVARQRLAQHGLRLILDFVPNHLALDHPWVSAHPDYFVQGTQEDFRQSPGDFFEAGDQVLAHGRDPYFPAWRDVVQINSFSPALRQAAIKEMDGIAAQCDGVRCDMAMLLLNNVFERTWKERAGVVPAQEYWSELISAVRSRHPDMLFLAEVYWDLERQLQQLGFDYCYDKRLFDLLEHDNAENIRAYLSTDLAYQDRLMRFIENHDEARAAAIFSPEKERAAAVILLTLPGAKLFYEGQFEGWQVRPPVFLARRPVEPVNTDLQAFYSQLLAVIVKEARLREGDWQLCACVGWPNNQSFSNLLVWSWQRKEERYLIVVNYAQQQAQARVQLSWNELSGRQWQLTDLLNGERFERDGNELEEAGLYVDLPGWGFYFLHFQLS
jgi:glycosidase